MGTRPQQRHRNRRHRPGFFSQDRRWVKDTHIDTHRHNQDKERQGVFKGEAESIQSFVQSASCILITGLGWSDRKACNKRPRLACAGLFQSKEQTERKPKLHSHANLVLLEGSRRSELTSQYHRLFPEQAKLDRYFVLWTHSLLLTVENLNGNFMCAVKTTSVGAKKTTRMVVAMACNRSPSTQCSSAAPEAGKAPCASPRGHIVVLWVTIPLPSFENRCCCNNEITFAAS